MIERRIRECDLNKLGDRLNQSLKQFIQSMSLQDRASRLAARRAIILHRLTAEKERRDHRRYFGLEED